MADRISITVNLTIHPEEELEASTRLLIEKAKDAATKAYARYSHFLVGVALLLDNGAIISGNNQENACYPSGLCAERVTFFAAKSQYPEAVIKKVAIVARKREDTRFKAATPCGSCRQVMSEYENNQMEKIRIYLPDSEGNVYESESVENLLPFKFSNENLKS